MYQGGRKEQTNNGNEAGPDASEWTLLCPFKVLLFVLCTIKVLFFFYQRKGALEGVLLVAYAIAILQSLPGDRCLGEFFSLVICTWMGERWFHGKDL